MIKVLGYILKTISPSKHPKLPELLFLAGTYFYPQVNVELLIRDKNSLTLFSWRNDEFGNLGWHIPGGIIRPNEQVKTRISQVILSEITALDCYTPINISNIGMSEIFASSVPSIRSHFISLIYIVVYDIDFMKINLKYDKKNKKEIYHVSKKMPENLISNHKRYKNLIKLSNSEIINKYGRTEF